MGDVHHEPGADGIGDGAEALEVDDAGVGGGSGDDHAGTVLGGEALDGVVVDLLGFGGDTVGDDVEEAAREVEGMAVGEVAAIGEGHGEDGVAGLEHGEVDGHVGGGAGVGLDVDVLGPEEGFGAVDGEAFDVVDEFAPVVVALAGEAFGVFVGEEGALGLADGAGDVVFGSDEFDVARLAPGFGEDGGADLGVGVAEGDGGGDGGGAGVDLADAAGVAGLGVEVGGEPGVEDGRNLGGVEDGGAEGEDVGVVVLAGHAGHEGVEDLGGADVGELVGGDGHAGAGGADEDAAVEGAVGDAAGDLGGEVGVVDGFGAVGAEVRDFDAVTLGKPVLDLPFQFKTAVVRGQSNLHGASFPNR